MQGLFDHLGFFELKNQEISEWKLKLQTLNANRANADVLSTTVESEIVSLEQMFSRLESLKTEKDRLSFAAQNLPKGKPKPTPPFAPVKERKPPKRVPVPPK